MLSRLSIAAVLFVGAGVITLPIRGQQPIARVGTVSIEQRDVTARVTLLEVRGGCEGGRARAAAELLAEALELEVARASGAAPTSADLDALLVHTIETSRDPALLDELGEHLVDRETFVRQVAAPRATTLKLRHHVASDPALYGADFEAWYRERAAEVSIVLVEETLAVEICRAYAHAWWLAPACGATDTNAIRR